jgi:DNA polymerase I-like protein with 3'-5' exonuclease and polymerase domains
MKLISLDIETYGACTHNSKGQVLPSQSAFHPQRALTTDGVSRNNMVLTCTITTEVHSCPCTKNYKAITLDQAKPCCTFTMHMDQEKDRVLLHRWLTWADTILGMNLPFDLQFLRACDHRFQFALPPYGKTLFDLSILNYLHSELRPERSLKSLGPVLGTHAYKRTIKDGKFRSPHDPEFLDYAAQDTHNTLLASSELARRILLDWPGTDKLSPYCIQHYSDCLWTIITMSEAGIPMSRKDLDNLQSTLLIQASDAMAKAESHGVQLEGTGSTKSKTEFLNVTNGLLSARGVDILSHPLAQFTEKTRAFSFSDANRNLIRGFLRDTDTREIAILEAAAAHQQAQKMLSTYIWPLLHGKRNKPEDKSSTILPLPHTGEADGLAFPVWYPVPSASKDASGSEGGTIQGRITCKNPSAQTFPPTIKATIKSRFHGGTILSLDLSQIELRVAALCSGDKSLLAAFNDGLDLHTDRAVQLFGKDCLSSPTFKKLERQVGKTMNFADLFLASPFRMRMSVHEMTGQLMPLAFFEEVAETRPDARPGLHAWQQSLIRTADAQGSLTLPFTGQSRTFVGGSSEHLNEIVNFPIQTQAGNTLLAIQRAIAPLLSPHVKMFLQIYDAVYLDVHPSVDLDSLKQKLKFHIEEVRDTGYWAMLQSHYGHTVPLEYDFS